MMSGKDSDVKNIKIEGDLVTSFFDSVDKISDQTLYAFIEELKKDIELIMQILYNSTNEMVVFFTFLLMMLKKLNPIDHSFTNAMHMCKNLAVQINVDPTGGQFKEYYEDSNITLISDYFTKDIFFLV